MSRYHLLFLAIAGLAVMIVLSRYVPVREWIDVFRSWIQGLGLLGVLAFVLAYTLITVLMVPVSGMTLAAGLAYGAWGFPLVIACATLSSAVAFLLGRHAAYNRVAQLANDNAKFRVLKDAVNEEGWRVVALLRLSPVLPFGLQNYLLSVTDIKLGPYMLATALSLMPVSALYVYIGSLGQTAGEDGLIKWVLLGFGLMATAMMVWMISKRAQTVLQNIQVSNPAVRDD